MNRTIFLVDGFNLYHSVRQAHQALKGGSTRWLDLHALCRSYLHVVGGGATLEGVQYFSALATHREAASPGVTARHRDFISCLEDSGVSVTLARFKAKSVYCEHCKTRLRRYEEKETDVAIACALLSVFVEDQADVAVLVTGDTDLAPAVRVAKALYPLKSVGFAFPYNRKNKQLDQLADFAFQISKEQYQRFQFPDPYVTKNGRSIPKPSSW